MCLYLRGPVARLSAFLVVAGSLATIGCGNPTGTVSGKVYYQEKPLKGGNVTFVHGETKKSWLSDIKEDGSYKVEKVPVGDVTITVETQSLKPAGRGKLPTYAPPAGKESPGGYKPPNLAEKAKRYTPIPGDYAKADTSKLKYKVESGSKDHDIKLD